MHPDTHWMLRPLVAPVPATIPFACISVARQQLYQVVRAKATCRRTSITAKT